MLSADRLDADEAADTVSRRGEFLERLVDGPKYNRDLRSELGVSRSTAYKALHELEELSLISRGEDGYEPTLLGRLLFEEYQRFHDNVENICHPGTLLSFLPTETDISPEVFDGANIYLADRHAPNRPVHMIEDTVRGASVLKGMGPVVLPTYVELFHELIVEEDLEAAFVFEQPVLDHLVIDYAEQCTEAFETGNLDVLLADCQLPFALLLVGDPIQQVGIVVYDRGGEFRGFVTNDTDYAVSWAHRVWNQYVDGSTRVATIADGEYEVESPESKR